MCEVMERYEKLAVSKALQYERIKRIQRMIEKGYPKEEILDLGYTEDEFTEAEQQMLQLV